MKILFSALLPIVAIYCISCHYESSVYKESNKMQYMIKKTTRPVELSQKWDLGQWQIANVLELKNYMGKKPSHFPKTQVKLLYDNNNLYVFFRVEDQYIRAIADGTHGNVWQDSCVEFFFAPDIENENNYFNLETNCGGMMLFGYNDKRNKTETYVGTADCEKVEFCHSLPEIIAEEITEPTTWTLSYKLPFDVIAKYSKITTPQSGIKWKANFYKCADKTSHPHWLTWSFVDHPTPNFHLSKYFGVLEFE